VRELAHDLRLLGRLDVLGRHEVVRHEHDLVRIEDALQPRLPELRDRQRRRNVIRHHQVNRHLDDLPRCHAISPSTLRQDLFRHCQTSHV
jgi:hypothetical protein